MIPIEVDHVTKQYGSHLAVDDISFTVGSGRIFGLLGPNGAGKTTTIRMIMNITMPDSGTVRIFGAASGKGGSKRIGYLPEERGLYRKMKVLEHLVFLGEIRGLDRATAKRRSEEWLEKLGGADWKKKKVEELSKGMQQKIQFIGCVMHEPDVLILDEPFSGLDPVNARILKETLLEFRDAGKTVVLSTHVMEQAEKLCDEIALINRARIVLQGTIGDLKRQYSPNRLVVRGRGESESLRGIAGVRSLVVSDGGVEVDLEPDFATGAFLREASRLYDFDSIVPHETSLDDIFVRVVGYGVEEANQQQAGGAV